MKYIILCIATLIPTSLSSQESLGAKLESLIANMKSLEPDREAALERIGSGVYDEQLLEFALALDAEVQAQKKAVVTKAMQRLTSSCPCGIEGCTCTTQRSSVVYGSTPQVVYSTGSTGYSPQRVVYGSSRVVYGSIGYSYASEPVTSYYSGPRYTRVTTPNTTTRTFRGPFRTYTRSVCRGGVCR